MEETTLNLKKYKTNTHNLRKILPLYTKHKKMLAVAVIFLICSGVFSIFQPIFSANALACLAEGKFQDAINQTLYACGCGLARLVFNGLDDYFYTKLNLQIRLDLTKISINSICSTKMSTLDNLGLGPLSERLSSDITNVSDVYLDVINLIFDVITNVVFLFYIAYLNVYMFLILLLYVVVLYIICTIRSRIWIRGRKLTSAARDEARTAYLEEIVGIRDVKLLNIKDEITEYSNKKFEKSLKIDQNINNKRNIIRRIHTLVTVIFDLIFIVLGVVFVDKNMLLLAGFLVIFSYRGRVDGLVNYLSSIKEYTAEGEISATRIYEIIEDYEKEQFGNETLDNFSGKIEIKNLSFSYASGEKVLDDLNMDFEPGKITSIVGKSGAGKTTILNIISKLYDVSEGEILFDGKNISSLTESAIHDNIGEVSQSPYIFNSSIKQNLLFVKPDATEEELINVLKQAQIYEDIEAMPDGIETNIGENGVKLSGGQKQRIAIARLLLANTKVIVFDESTSALDNNSQNKIVELLESIKNEHTIIIVAHRLSSIVGSDKIYMLDDGKVLAEGSHKELMKNCKEYENLYKLEEKNAKIE